jgi:hypothetical protein
VFAGIRAALEGDFAEEMVRPFATNGILPNI